MVCASVFLLAVLTAIVYGSYPDYCPETALTFLYESFQCKPKWSNSSNCPLEYDCVDLAANSNLCYFNGNFYKPEVGVESRLTWEHCMGCTCVQENEGPATFSCYYADCPIPNTTEGCRPDQRLGECCYESEVCPPFHICTIGKQQFLEGHKFMSPTEKCTKCHCGKGEGGVGVVTCERQYCVDLLHFQDQIRRKCAPLYQEADACCPSGWVCPEDNITFEEEDNTGAGPFCTFGTKLLSKGTKFTSGAGQWGMSSCECVLPPFACCKN